MPFDIAVVGAGYVGLVAAAALASLGHDVVCIDHDATRIEVLRTGAVPMHEPGLDALVGRGLASRRLRFSTCLADAAQAEVVFIAVGTPVGANGEADVRAVLSAARDVGAIARRRCILVVKSTVPIGTTHAAVAAAREAASVPIHGCHNPEFLREGTAVGDFLVPDRVVLGVEDEHTCTVMRALYAPLTRDADQLLCMAIVSAELTKYAANAMLATRITVMNELASLCERVGADVEDLQRGIGSDRRIGPAFLQPGPGYGGSCFPKDVKAIVARARDVGTPLTVFAAVDSANARRRTMLLRRTAESLATYGVPLTAATVAVWGLAFKGGTDDLRESPALALVEQLLSRGVTVAAHDPAARAGAAQRFAGAVAEGQLRLPATPLDALDGAQILVVATEWPEYRHVPLGDIRARLACPLVVDGRNLWTPAAMAAHGLEYHSVGRASVRPHAQAIA